MAARIDDVEKQVKAQVAPYEEEIPLNLSVVNDNTDYVAVTDILVDIVRKRKELDELRKSITRPIDDSKKRVMALFRPAETKLEQAEQMLKLAINGYLHKQNLERIQLEAQLRREHDEAAEAIKAEAALLAQDGNVDQAYEILATIPSVPVVLSDRPNTNVSTRSVWKGIAPQNKQQMVEFLSYIITNDMWNLITVNQPALDALARSTKGTTHIPGVVIHEEKIVVTRSV